MTLSAQSPIDSSSSISNRAFILRTAVAEELDRIVEPNVQAVIYEPPTVPRWLAEVTAAVESSALHIPRSLLPSASYDDIAAWLASQLPRGVLSPHVHDALCDDVLGLVDRLRERVGASRFMVRLFTAAPTRDCGFHVDTVPTGAADWGLLRVYNGAGTAYVEPENVTSVAEFYRYLGRRERLERERGSAFAAGNAAAFDRLEGQLSGLDREPPFLQNTKDILIAPARATVAFKHLDIRLMWTRHAKAVAWIHCSPMKGVPRLVVNVTAPEPAPRRVR